MPREVSVVAHSHWDREWYAPLESYRLRLVAMMEELIELLETDDRFTHFHLDGQVALVDDYLEVAPGSEKRLRGLVEAGRLSVGPWYVLMDEFCVSGETLVRNLQLGLERSAALGADPTVGYLPDMFGHVAQMPQLLSAAGLDHAVVWRGVPAAVNRTGFRWEAPDGTGVRAEYLPVGYANGAFLPATAEALDRRMAAHEAEIGGYLEPGWPMLLMNGGDHHHPHIPLPGLLESANRSHSRFCFRQTSLAEHLERAPRAGLPVWRGELRSSHRAPLLMGVLSNRVDLKAAAAATAAALEAAAEPLATLWLPPDLWPSDLERAWLEVVHNSAHDSICACSADAVGRAVRQRYDTATALARGVVDRAVAIAGVALRDRGPAVLNPSARPRRGLVELLLPGTEAHPGTQQLEVTEPGRRAVHGRGRDLPRLLGQLTEEGWLGPAARAVEARLSPVDPGAGPLTVTLDHDATRGPGPDLPSTLAEVWARAGAGSDRELTLVAARQGWQRVLAWVDDVPGFGWAGWAPVPPPVPVTVSGLRVANGLVTVVVDPESGSFELDGVAGQNTLVDDGDAGDTYNFSPVAGSGGVCRPLAVAVTVGETGPLRAVVRVERRYRWPRRLEGAGRSPEEAEVTVVSDLEMRAGEGAVQVTTTFDNPCRDHRVRAVFPLGRPAASSTAECAFATVTRGLEAEGGFLEEALATFPSRRFFTAGDLTVTHQGLHEYEVVQGGAAVALTLLRATGVLSRAAPGSRPNVAGPPLPVPDAQMVGEVTCRYALAPRCQDPFRLAESVWAPLVPFVSGGHGHLAAKGSRLAVDPGRAEVSALLRRSGRIEMRVFNPTETSCTVALPGRRGDLVDLRGRAQGPWVESFEVEPGRIVTARLEQISLD